MVGFSADREVGLQRDEIEDDGRIGWRLDIAIASIHSGCRVPTCGSARFQPRIEDIANAVADEVDGDGEHEDYQPGDRPRHAEQQQ